MVEFDLPAKRWYGFQESSAPSISPSKRTLNDMKLAKLCVLFDFDDRRLRLGGAGGCTGSGRASRRKTTGRRHVTASGRAARRAGARATRYSRAADAHRGTGGRSRRPSTDGSTTRSGATAALIDTFVQEEPVEGAPATEQTEVRVAYDSERLYFSIYAHYSDRRPDARQSLRSRQAGQRRYRHDLHRTLPRLPPRLLLFRQRLRRAARLDDRRAERAEQFGEGEPSFNVAVLLPAVSSSTTAGRRR